MRYVWFAHGLFFLARLHKSRCVSSAPLQPWLGQWMCFRMVSHMLGLRDIEMSLDMEMSLDIEVVPDIEMLLDIEILLDMRCCWI